MLATTTRIPAAGADRWRCRASTRSASSVATRRGRPSWRRRFPSWSSRSTCDVPAPDRAAVLAFATDGRAPACRARRTGALSEGMGQVRIIKHIIEQTPTVPLALRRSARAGVEAARPERDVPRRPDPPPPQRASPRRPDRPHRDDRQRPLGHDVGPDQPRTARTMRSRRPSSTTPWRSSARCWSRTCPPSTPKLEDAHAPGHRAEAAEPGSAKLSDLFRQFSSSRIARASGLSSYVSCTRPRQYPLERFLRSRRQHFGACRVAIRPVRHRGSPKRRLFTGRNPYFALDAGHNDL